MNVRVMLVGAVGGEVVVHRGRSGGRGRRGRGGGGTSGGGGGGELCTICATCKPDVVCLVESWLCDDISDNEIKIPGYQLHRFDRNRHGGGVLMYASEQLIVNPLPLCGSNLELLPLSVELLDQCICISRPPSSHIDIFDSLTY